MDISGLAQIESCANELARAAKSLADYFQTTPAPGPDAEPSKGLPLVAPDGPSQAHRARRSIFASVAKLQNLIAEPGHFVERLASQNQLLACLHWLNEFQVLACIPLQGSVLGKDVAELTGVPEAVLIRVVRMTSTAGFLCEPRPRHVAHTTLSAGFVTKPSLGDAAMFLSGTAARAALHLAGATQRYGEVDMERPDQTAFALTERAQQSFRQACEERPKLQRQWAAYLRSSMGVDEAMAEVLSRLDWERHKSVCIVEPGPHPSCVVQRIAEHCSHLHITVQISEPLPSDGLGHAHSSDGSGSSGGSGREYFKAPNAITRPASRPSPTVASPLLASRPSQTPSPPSRSGATSTSPSARVSVQQRATGQPQTVRDAGVYVLNLGSPSTSPAESLASVTSRVAAELLVHLPILRDNRGATLVVAMRLLPDPSSVDVGVEAAARTRDLVLLQLANERDLEVSELVDLIQGIRDWSGRLAVVSRARGRDNAVMALGVKFLATG